MQRAGVFIGVRKTGKLPELQDAVASAQRMHAWALGQGMTDGTSAVLITDEAGPVGVDMLSEAVSTIIDTVQPEQLIVYFAGHGVALRGEQWLLSKAPDNASAAVDVRWTADIASTGSVPHVVLISDACRTAPEGVQAQNVQGVSIFPNTPTNDQRFVDLYFACSLGRPAAEIQDSADAAKSYRAVYTEVLLETLAGDYEEAFVHLTAADTDWYADARKVRDVLRDRVPKKIRSKRLKARYGQVPQAMILSDPGAWLARLDALPGSGPGAAPAPPPAPVAPSSRGPGRPAAPAPPAPPASEKPPRRPARRPARRRMGAAERALRDDLDRTTAALAPAHGPDHFETGCGVKVRGAQIVSVVAAPGLYVEQLSGDVVRAYLSPQRCASLVVRLDSGDVTVVPLIDQYLTGLTVDDGELISVELEPSANSPRWGDYQYEVDQVRELRARASAASAYGRFEPSGEEFQQIAQRMQSLKFFDPALSIYAAYAYYALGAHDRIDSMAGYLFADLQVRLFDLELLSRHLVGRQPRKDETVLPAMPLLSQGWSLVHSHGTRMPAGLGDLGRLAKDSLWSLYRPEAYDLLATALEKRRIR